MNTKPVMEITVGSEYKILSLGGRDNILETRGIFKGFISIGVDEIGLVIKLGKSHKSMEGKLRIVPLHVILAIDVLAAKQNDKQDSEKEMPHYVG
jgi:hypothetical protein